MKMGITGYDETLDGKLDLFELDFFKDTIDLVKKSKVIMSLNQFFYRQFNTIPLKERLELIESKFTASRVIGFSIRITPRFFNQCKLEDKVIPLAKEIEKNFSLPAWIDLPRECSLNPKNDIRFSCDPLWGKPRKGGYWKIHGWHENRWVRRYSECDLIKLDHLTARHGPDILIFGHSQRAVQLNEFLKVRTKNEKN